MNVHSSGGYFMWPPGAYTPSRTTLPYPPYGTLNYFDQTASSVLDRIYNYRHTAILPQQTGPVADVLYSAAGNSADEAYYNHGIIGYDFEIGASKVLATGQSQGTGFQPCYGAVGTGGGTGTCNANLVNEGHDEGMEFANGNYALLASALQYSNDTTPPVVNTAVTSDGKGTYTVKFTSNEASSIYYTTDGSTPTTASTEWKPNRPRELPDAARPRARHDAQVDRHRLQGQHVRGEVAGARADRHARHGRRQRPGDAGPDAGRPGDLRGLHPGRRQDYTATTTATVISTAGDATLSVADPSTDHHRPPDQRQLRARVAAAGPRHDQDVDRPDLQRVGADHVQAVDRGQRAAAHGHVQQDADVHPEHHHSVALRQGVGRVVIRPTPWSHLRGQSDSYVRLPACADVHGSLRIGAASEGFRGFQTEGVAVKPWMGAAAVAAVMAVLPSAALADDGYSVVQFKLPDKATMERLEAQGADFDHGFIDAPGGGILVSAVVDDAQKALFEAQGYPAVKTLQTQADVDSCAPSARRRSRPRPTPRPRCRAPAASKSASAAAGTVRAQRADYWEDVSGRYLSSRARPATRRSPARSPTAARAAPTPATR